ncbi:unnamed protein product [Linum trigynum]
MKLEMARLSDGWANLNAAVEEVRATHRWMIAALGLLEAPTEVEPVAKEKNGVEGGGGTRETMAATTGKSTG